MQNKVKNFNQPQKVRFLHKGVEEEEEFLGNRKTLILRNWGRFFPHLLIETTETFQTLYSKDEKTGIWVRERNKKSERKVEGD